ncbi:MAG: hypothetical protein JW720_02565 [Sedimentisphaerales bacterium]|nr:hypothetical protein [Sedimentisphaerales bacterium]
MDKQNSQNKTGKPRYAKRRAIIPAILLGAILCQGCNVIFQASLKEPENYYLNPEKSLPQVGRIVLVELSNESTYPKISADMTDALFQAIQKKQVFSLGVVSQTDQQWKSLQLETEKPYTFQQLSAIKEQLNCNAILTGTITAYQPYPHLSIGLRLKLTDLADGQLLWAFEQVWDTTDKTTEKRIKDYFEAQIRSGVTPLHEQLVIVSSLKFVKFVAYEVAKTM